MWRDTNLAPVRARCHVEASPEDPTHVSCAPVARPATIYWDGGDNLFFRPMTEALGFVSGGEAVNVNSLDEVPDSAWFTNRLGRHEMSIEQLALGACTEAQVLDGAGASDGAWIVDKGKMEGSTDGFRVTVPGKGKYLFKADDSPETERPSAAQALGLRAYYAAGYPSTCEQVVYFRPATLRLTPGLRQKHNFDDETDFDKKALDAILAHCPRRGEFVRMAASAWLPGYNIGGFQFDGTRADNPNDIIPHEDRRELRGLRVLASWLNRFDERTGNTIDAWFPDGGGAFDSSPGHVVHYHLDTSEALGSEWDWPDISRRLGHSYVADWGDIAGDFFSLGALSRPWDVSKRTPGREIFGYFDVESFVPDEWKNEWPLAAFSRMTERDAAWMARILARFTPEMVHALARAADFSDPGNTSYIEAVLQGRLRKNLESLLASVVPYRRPARGRCRQVVWEGPRRVAPPARPGALPLHRAARARGLPPRSATRGGRDLRDHPARSLPRRGAGR